YSVTDQNGDPANTGNVDGQGTSRPIWWVIRIRVRARMEHKRAHRRAGSIQLPLQRLPRERLAISVRTRSRHSVTGIWISHSSEGFLYQGKGGNLNSVRKRLTFSIPSSSVLPATTSATAVALAKLLVPPTLLACCSSG